VIATSMSRESDSDSCSCVLSCLFWFLSFVFVFGVRFFLVLVWSLFFVFGTGGWEVMINDCMIVSAQGKECVYWVVWSSGYVASVDR
jgi:hypothetical protein